MTAAEYRARAERLLSVRNDRDQELVNVRKAAVWAELAKSAAIEEAAVLAADQQDADAGKDA